MNPTDRTKLLGTYRTPRCKVGGYLRCAIRGRVQVRGITDAPLPWPLTLQRNGGRTTLILCGDLARAVRRESETAICQWWGVSAQTVSKRRKALGVASITPGTSQLLSRWAPETVQSDEAARKLADVQGSPDRAAKIAAAKRGKPRPESVKAALRKANLGRKASTETRQKMSQAHKQRGSTPPAAGVPWTAAEDALLGTMPDADVTERTGRSLRAVRSRRYDLGIGLFKVER